MRERLEGSRDPHCMGVGYSCGIISFYIPVPICRQSAGQSGCCRSQPGQWRLSTILDTFPADCSTARIRRILHAPPAPVNLKMMGPQPPFATL